MIPKLKLFSFSILLFTSLLHSQEKVSERKLLGLWELKMDIKSTIEEESEDRNFFEKIMLKTVSSFVQNVMEEVEVNFEFKKQGVLNVSTIIDNEKKEKEVFSWKINRKGKLLIEDLKTQKNSLKSNGVWTFYKGSLYQIDSDGKIEKNIRLKKM